MGYFSADFYDHAVAVLIAGVFEHHDRSRFEITAFALNPPLAVEDDMRKRLIPAFDRFIDVFSRADDEIAKLSRDLEIDIAIDLHGHTQYSRTGIFARRAAPIQVNYLEFPGTMGVPFMGYIVADSIIIPNDSRRFYVEKVVYMPHSYQPRDDKQPISPEQSRAGYGLPENAFVFCCFNILKKVLPDTFHLWMRILARVENSVIWLRSDVDEAVTNLRREAIASGIDPQRLIFSPRIPVADHLARHRRADLFLDTYYYNAHIAGSDALWVGLPMLTQLGNTFAGRVAASLNCAVGMNDLVVTYPSEYEALAVHLATHPEHLDAIRKKLAENKGHMPLFNGCECDRRSGAAGHSHSGQERHSD